MNKNVLVLSIKEEYANKILSGEKKVEFRKIKPKKIGPGDVVLVYIPSPKKTIIGAFIIDNIIVEPKEKLWRTTKQTGGVTRQEFDFYYNGSAQGVGICIGNVISAKRPIGLSTIKTEIRRFKPPQSFIYLDFDELKNSSCNALMRKITSESKKLI